MPLTPSTNAQVISDMGTFSFPMMDGEIVVPVQVTDDTLECMASRDLLIDGRARVATEGNWK